MKLKLLTIVLAISTLVLGLVTYVFYLDLDFHAKVIKDRELTITNYQKVIRAIGRSNKISVDKLKTELKNEFKIDNTIGYNDFSKEYYYLMFPKKYDINSNGILKFMGLELILDDQKEFKTIHMYKP